MLDFIELSFIEKDQDTGAPVTDVRAKCFQKGNENACTQKSSNTLATVIIRVPIQKLIWHSLLFQKKTEKLATKDPKIHIMFMHPDYDNVVKPLLIANLHQDPMLQYPVKMHRKFQD